MRITIALFAHFRDNRFVTEEKEIQDGATVADIARQLGMDIEEIGITMLNSRHCRLDSCPQDGDVLAIFPEVGGG